MLLFVCDRERAAANWGDAEAGEEVSAHHDYSGFFGGRAGANGHFANAGRDVGEETGESLALGAQLFKTYSLNEELPLPVFPAPAGWPGSTCT